MTRHLQANLQNLPHATRPCRSAGCRCLPAAAADRYVAPTGADGNPGTRAAPLKTISRADTVARPGDVVRVLPGVYRESVRTVASGTANARITYTSTVKWGARIIPPAGSGWENDGDWVVIDGFDVSAPNGREGIYNDGSHVRITRNHVHAVRVPRCTVNGGAGINSGTPNYTGVDIAIERNLVHDIGSLTRRCNGVQGIYVAHRQGRVANNVVYRVSTWGIHLWHAPRDIDVVNNLSFANGYGGIVVGAGDAPHHGRVPTENIRVINNIVLDNRVGIAETGAKGDNIRFLHNLVWRNGDDWSLKAGRAHVGTVSMEPRFVRYLRNGGGDYRLRAGSPAVDRGSPLAAPDVDLDGVRRPQGPTVDVGPHERRP
jgi:Right handed beta helix region/Protein of unknown function (DUF1565)